MKIFELTGNTINELYWVEALINPGKEERREEIDMDPNIISDPEELYEWIC